MADTNTYAITGIPAPSDAELKTKVIPFAPGMPVRREISAFFPSDDADTQRQWTLFILALESFKKMSVDQKLSYFQVAGIHGYPHGPWDGSVPPGRSFFCQHNSLTFSTWHRPYLLLVEQLLWTHMKDLIKEWTPKLTEEGVAAWEKSANTWRLPYWDWAQRQDYHDPDQSPEFALPYACTLPTIAIYPPPDTVVGNPTQYPNPLTGFTNPETSDGEPLPFGEMPEGKTQWNIRNNRTLPWNQCKGTSRYGILRRGNGFAGLDGENNFSTANAMFKNFSAHWYPMGDFRPPGTLADAVNRMFSPEYNDTWGSFGSTKWFNEGAQRISTGYLSLEYIHNNIHVMAGGQDLVEEGLGHMSDVPVAAFDPIFWLHHCNIDRLLAMWQALNWTQWFGPGFPVNPDPNPRPDPNQVPDQKPTDNLSPFHAVSSNNADQGYYTSDTVRDWTKLNYQYSDLVPKPEAVLEDGTLNEDRYQLDLRTYIHATYPSTLEFIQTLQADRSITNEEFFGPNNAAEVTWNDYLINVVYDRYALDGRSYKIEFWLGGADNDPNSTFSFPENLVGEVYSLGGLAPATGGEDDEGCANCGAQQAARVLSKAQVPLTIPILSQALDEGYQHISTTRGRDVVPYLEKHLHWKFIELGAGEQPASQFPNTTISVWRGTGKPQGVSENGEKLPPMYSNYLPQYAPTDGKDGGLTAGDAVLGEDHREEFHFRTFGASE